MYIKYHTIATVMACLIVMAYPTCLYMSCAEFLSPTGLVPSSFRKGEGGGETTSTHTRLYKNTREHKQKTTCA